MNDLFEVDEPIASIELKRGELLLELTRMGYNTIPLRKEQVEQIQASVDLAKLEKAQVA